MKEAKNSNFFKVIALVLSELTFLGRCGKLVLQVCCSGIDGRVRDALCNS